MIRVEISKEILGFFPKDFCLLWTVETTKHYLEWLRSECDFNSIWMSAKFSFKKQVSEDRFRLSPNWHSRKWKVIIQSRHSLPVCLQTYTGLPTPYLTYHRTFIISLFPCLWIRIELGTVFTQWQYVPYMIQTIMDNICHTKEGISMNGQTNMSNLDSWFPFNTFFGEMKYLRI